MSCTETEMFLHVLVLNYEKFNTIFKYLFRNKMFSCLHLFDSLHRSQIYSLFLAELFTFTSSSQEIIPCKIRAVLLQNTLLTITWKESLQLFSIITANPTAPQSRSLSHHTEPGFKLFSNVDHESILEGGEDWFTVPVATDKIFLKISIFSAKYFLQNIRICELEHWRNTADRTPKGHFPTFWKPCNVRRGDRWISSKRPSDDR